MNELYQLVDLTHGLLRDLKYGGLIEYQVEIEELEIKSSSPVQRGRLLDLMVSPTDILQFLEALRSTGQEHVANFITQNGCE